MGRHDEGFFTARDNSRLFWISDLPDEAVQPRAHIAVVHGYAEHCGRYAKTIQALVKDGYAVHAFDYRGHGQADGRRGFCGAFTDYVDDLELFWNRVVAGSGGKKCFLLAHSLGGLIAIHLLSRRPRELTGVVLSAPYIKLALKPPAFKVLAAKVVGRVIPWLPLKNELTPQDLTRDLEEQKLVDKDPLYFHVVTPRWFNESNAAQVTAAELGPSITLPMLMVCGANDGVASTPAAKAFFEQVGSRDKELKEYPGMLHEPLNEIGREQVWQDISRWISAHL
jgi:lysophospholipase